MNLAKVSANGQVTVPVEIRRKLNLKEGDKIIFFERNDGEVVINNASSTAIMNAQKAFDGRESGNSKAEKRMLVSTIIFIGAIFFHHTLLHLRGAEHHPRN